MNPNFLKAGIKKSTSSSASASAASLLLGRSGITKHVSLLSTFAAAGNNRKAAVSSFCSSTSCLESARLLTARNHHHHHLAFVIEQKHSVGRRFSFRQIVNSKLQTDDDMADHQREEKGKETDIVYVLFYFVSLCAVDVSWWGS
jgi:hypothetical protein